MTKVKTVKEQLDAARFKVFELEQEYQTQLYFETMPDYDPLYKYCYQTSCTSIPYPLQSVDAWIRAVIVHMSLRKTGHGGATTKAVLVSVPELQTQDAIDEWIEGTGKQLRKKMRAKASIAA
jgi:hypothetical protein